MLVLVLLALLLLLRYICRRIRSFQSCVRRFDGGFEGQNEPSIRTMLKQLQPDAQAFNVSRDELQLLCRPMGFGAMGSSM